MSAEAIVLAWLLHHPARIQPIIGTVNPKRIEASCRAVDVVLSKEEWYRLYRVGRGGTGGTVMGQEGQDSAAIKVKNPISNG